MSQKNATSNATLKMVAPQGTNIVSASSFTSSSAPSSASVAAAVMNSGNPASPHSQKAQLKHTLSSGGASASSSSSSFFGASPSSPFSPEAVISLFNAKDSSGQEQALEKYFKGVTQRFLGESKVHNNPPDEKTLKDKFSNAGIPQEGGDISSYFLRFVQDGVMETTHCHSPNMIGHMTSALPFYHRGLAQLVTAMNQNTVKIETSSMITFLERETLAKLHKAYFEKEASFYQYNIHNPDACLGCITSGGTLANLTALWVARNKALGPKGEFEGVEKEGLFRALKHYGYEDAIVLGSQTMHYSFKKATDMLGLGTSGLVTIPYDDKFRVRLDLMQEKLEECQRKKVLVLAVVGVAGATEAGSFDDLKGLGDLCRQFGVHFHVDGAWGGPLIFSKNHKGKLAGVEKADSVTVDGHKQLYTPMGCGVVLFNNPADGKVIRKTANYIIRKESLDVGKFSPEGSRPASAIYLHANLSLLGVKGYETVIDRTCSLVSYMANKVRASDDFEMILDPMSNIMLYRWIPSIPTLREKRRKNQPFTREENELINQKNIELQKLVCKEGESFVSRTTVFSPKYGMGLVGLRVVIANPTTLRETIDFALNEQRILVKKI